MRYRPLPLSLENALSSSDRGRSRMIRQERKSPKGCRGRPRISRPRPCRNDHDPMKRASAQESPAERCRLAALPLLAFPHRPTYFQKRSGSQQKQARGPTRRRSGSPRFEDEAPLFDPAYDDRPNAGTWRHPARQTERLAPRKPEKSPPVRDLCAPLPRQSTPFQTKRPERRPIQNPGQRLAMKYFDDRAGRFRGAHKSRT